MSARFVASLVLSIACSAAGASTVPLVFEENRGQAPAAVRYLAHYGQTTLLLTARETIWRSGEDFVRMRFAGGADESVLEGEDGLSGRSHYYTGTHAVTNVPHFARVRRANVYRSIDAVMHASATEDIELDFVIAPGADPRQIVFAFDGIERLAPRDDGTLVAETRTGAMQLHPPVAYQVVDGVRRSVGARYELRGIDRAAICVDAYDTSRTLIIDPVIAFLTYLGGNRNENESGEYEHVALDAAGNVYVTGATDSVNFPGTPLAGGTPSAGQHQAFVTKINPGGNAVVYSVYFGGSLSEEGRGIAVTAAGEAFIAGNTWSADFPVTSGAYQKSLASKFLPDAFLVRLRKTGTIRYATYLGGADYDTALDVAADAQGRATITGQTSSKNFPVTGGAVQKTNKGGFDAFVARFDTNAFGAPSLLFSTYLGGSNTDAAESVAISSSGSSYVTGTTESANFPVKNAWQPAFGGGVRDAFVARISADGMTLVYATFLGGQFQDMGRGIAVSSIGSAYVTGYTEGGSFPSKGGTFDPSYNGAPCCGPDTGDAFVARFSASGSLAASTFLGGGRQDDPNAIAIAPNGDVAVAGTTRSDDFPALHAVQAAPSPAGGTPNAFVTRMRGDLSALLWSTFLGAGLGTSGSAVAAGNNITCMGGRNAGGLPTTAASIQPMPGGGHEIYVLCLRECTSTTVIDVSTGAVNGTAILTGADDDEWTVVPPAGTNLVARARAAYPSWVAPPPTAQWITGNASSNAPVGTYTYQFAFDLGTALPGRTCTLDFQWAVDNNVTFTLDGGAAIATSPPNQSSSFMMLHAANPVTLPASTGVHTLTATVTNLGGPTGLLVVGKVECTCP